MLRVPRTGETTSAQIVSPPPAYVSTLGSITGANRTHQQLSGESSQTQRSTQYALRGSQYETKVMFSTNTWNKQDPFYPVSGRSAAGGRNIAFLQQAEKIFNDGTQTLQQKKEAIVALGIKLDLRGLEFFNMPGNVSAELKEVNGKLIADIINHKSGDEAVIKRVIEPMSGTGTYSNWIRAVGFQREMIVNDINPLVTLTQGAIVYHPNEVQKKIKEIKSEVLKISKNHGFDFDENFIIKIDKLPPSISIDSEINKNQGLRPEEKTEKNTGKKEILQTFCNSEKAKEFRQEIRTYFEEIASALVPIENGQIALDTLNSESRIHFAALFYIAQNATASYSDTVKINKSPSGEYTMHLPMSILSSEKCQYIRLFPKVTNDEKINFISHVHNNKLNPTKFVAGDGWELLKNSDISSSDLIILSGHFSNVYLSEADFEEKIKEYIIPAADKGAQILIMNSFSQGKEDMFKKHGFQVSTCQRTSTAKGDFLLALKNIITDDAVLTQQYLDEMTQISAWSDVTQRLADELKPLLPRLYNEIKRTVSESTNRDSCESLNEVLRVIEPFMHQPSFEKEQLEQLVNICQHIKTIVTWEPSLSQRALSLATRCRDRIEDGLKQRTTTQQMVKNMGRVSSSLFDRSVNAMADVIVGLSPSGSTSRSGQHGDPQRSTDTWAQTANALYEGYAISNEKREKNKANAEIEEKRHQEQLKRKYESRQNTIPDSSSLNIGVATSMNSRSLSTERHREGEYQTEDSSHIFDTEGEVASLEARLAKLREFNMSNLLDPSTSTPALQRRLDALRSDSSSRQAKKSRTRIAEGIDEFGKPFTSTFTW